VSLNVSSSTVRPFAGRDEAFALAMHKAEKAAQPPEPEAPKYVARTHSGHVQRANGSLFIPGKYFDRAILEELPLI
jgi:hypothetical protein